MGTVHEGQSPRLSVAEVARIGAFGCQFDSRLPKSGDFGYVCLMQFVADEDVCPTGDARSAT